MFFFPPSFYQNSLPPPSPSQSPPFPKDQAKAQMKGVREKMRKRRAAKKWLRGAPEAKHPKKVSTGTTDEVLLSGEAREAVALAEKVLFSDEVRENEVGEEVREEVREEEVGGGDEGGGQGGGGGGGEEGDEKEKKEAISQNI